MKHQHISRGDASEGVCFSHTNGGTRHGDVWSRGGEGGGGVKLVRQAQDLNMRKCMIFQDHVPCRVLFWVAIGPAQPTTRGFTFFHLYSFDTFIRSLVTRQYLVVSHMHPHPKRWVSRSCSPSLTTSTCSGLLFISDRRFASFSHALVHWTGCWRWLLVYSWWQISLCFNTADREAYLRAGTFEQNRVKLSRGSPPMNPTVKLLANRY